MADCQIRKLIEKRNDAIPKEYNLSFGEIEQLHNIFKDEGIITALVYAHNLGVIRGTRARDRDRCSAL